MSFELIYSGIRSHLGCPQQDPFPNSKKIEHKVNGVSLKPVLHQKPQPHWVISMHPMRKKQHKQHEMYMANANHILAYPRRTIFYWFVLGLALGLWGRALSQAGFALGLQGVLDTNMLISATLTPQVGGRTQRKDPTQMISHRSGI